MAHINLMNLHQDRFKSIQEFRDQKKDRFPKLVNDTCRILAGWKNKYNNHHGNRFTEANYGVAFMTIGAEKQYDNKIKEFTCCKCGKVGNYSSECDEDHTVKATNSSKQVSNFLVLNDDKKTTA